MTFCVGGPRYFENNVCLQNSFRHAPDDRNQAREFIIDAFLGIASLFMDLHYLGNIMSFPRILPQKRAIMNVNHGGTLKTVNQTYLKMPMSMDTWPLN